MGGPWVLPAAGIAAFLLTDIDDLLVLVAFFADRSLRTRDIFVGQYAGIVVLMAASATAWLARLVVPEHLIGLLGLVPVALGIGGLVALLRGPRDGGGAGEALGRARSLAARRTRFPPALAVAIVTVANGGDNVGVYVPLFASATLVQLVILSAAFLAMTAAWLGLAWLAVRNPLLGPRLERWGGYLLPPALLLLGAWILAENGTVAWLVRLAS